MIYSDNDIIWRTNKSGVEFRVELKELLSNLLDFIGFFGVNLGSSPVSRSLKMLRKP